MKNAKTLGLCLSRVEGTIGGRSVDGSSFIPGIGAARILEVWHGVWVMSAPQLDSGAKGLLSSDDQNVDELFSIE